MNPAEMLTWLERSIEKLLLQIDAYIRQHGPEFLGNLLTAALVLLVGTWLAKRVSGLLASGLDRAQLDVTLSRFVVRIAHALMVTIVVIAALTRLGINTTSLTAILAAAGLAIGLALQGSLSNFASGIMLILFRPFKVGDFVEAGSTKGIVEEVHIFNTVLLTPDNVRIIVPNSNVTENQIQNFSAEPYRRIDLVIGCGYTDDLRQVKEFLSEVVASDRRILAKPEPLVAVSELADHSVNLVVRPWVATQEYWCVRFDLIETIKLGFDERGFSIPFPQRDIHVHQVQSTAPVSLPMRDTAAPALSDSEVATTAPYLRRRAA